jgi:hypothetical protein
METMIQLFGSMIGFAHHYLDRIVINECSFRLSRSEFEVYSFLLITDWGDTLRGRRKKQITEVSVTSGRVIPTTILMF